MNESVQQALEFGKVRQILARYAVTSMGKRKARELTPGGSAAALRQSQQETSEMARAFQEGYSLPLGSIEDVSEHAERAAAGGGPLEPAVLWKVAQCLHTAERVSKSLRRVGRDYPALAALAHTLPLAPELIGRIESAIDANARVLDGASAELKSIRQRIKRLRGRIERTLKALIESPALRPHLQYGKPTMCRERYVLPINAYSKKEAPGVVHGSSDSGATLYIEPFQIIEPGNDLAEAIGEEEEEILRVLWDLTRATGEERHAIVRATDSLGEVDLVRAKARMSNAFRMCEPKIDGAPALSLQEARHPLLLWLTRHGDAPEKRSAGALPEADDLDFDSVEPIDIRLGDDFNMLMITGPNTGGKTVALKTIGLLCIMARSGMHVPARKAAIPFYDAVYADIGDEQSLEQSLSTFSSHMSRIVEILLNATSQSLVLLDELGAGTDPEEGGALGEAILKRLALVRCQTVVVTHLGRLKTFATTRPQVENASMEFDTETLRPTYRLLIGSVGSSNALQIAQRLGVPPKILADARQSLDAESGGQYSSALDEVRLARQDAEERRDRMQYLEGEAEKLKKQYEEALARLKAEEDRRGAGMGLEIRDALEGLLSQAQRLHDDIRPIHKSLARRVRAMREELRRCLGDISRLLEGHKIDHALQKGDEVYVIKLHKWGVVERVDERRGRARVRVGEAQVEIGVEELQPWGDEIQ